MQHPASLAPSDASPLPLDPKQRERLARNATLASEWAAASPDALADQLECWRREWGALVDYDHRRSEDRAIHDAAEMMGWIVPAMSPRLLDRLVDEGVILALWRNPALPAPARVHAVERTIAATVVELRHESLVPHGAGRAMGAARALAEHGLVAGDDARLAPVREAALSSASGRYEAAMIALTATRLPVGFLRALALRYGPEEDFELPALSLAVRHPDAPLDVVRHGLWVAAAISHATRKEPRTGGRRTNYVREICDAMAERMDVIADAECALLLAYLRWRTRPAPAEASRDAIRTLPATAWAALFPRLTAHSAVVALWAFDRASEAQRAAVAPDAWTPLLSRGHPKVFEAVMRRLAANGGPSLSSAEPRDAPERAAPRPTAAPRSR